jgi:GH25 family lysozyme M1 (1,4-beta-N-acetylmuramidase)
MFSMVLACPRPKGDSVATASAVPSAAMVSPPPSVAAAGSSRPIASSSANTRPGEHDSECVDLVAGRAPADGDASAQLQSHPPARLKNNARGFDTSTPAPFRTLRDAGFAFSFVQAAIGTHANTAFAKNWSTAKSCGFPRGAYQFTSDSGDGGALANTLLDAVGSDIGEMPLTLDVEKPPSCTDDCCHQSCTEWNLRAQSWLDTVEKRTGRKAMIYIVEPFFAQCMCASTKWSDRALWLAAWPRFDFPEKPRLGGFSAWTLYQYEGNVIRYGGALDLSLFRGNKTDLDDWIASLVVTNH